MTAAREQKTGLSRPGLARACDHVVGQDLAKQVTVHLTAANAKASIGSQLIRWGSPEA